MSQNQPRKNKKSKRIWKKITVLLVVFMILGAGTAFGAVAYAASTLPEWDPAQLSGAKSSVLYDDQELIISHLYAEENRTEIKLDRVPPELIQAFVATEDRDFYTHHGVNFRGIIRAVVRNIQAGDLTSQGASTITQQLARNAFLTFDKSWERKLQEVIIAFRLESNYSKEEILTMYLNKIYFGAGAYGVQAAANTYFGKDVDALNLEECALLAGLVQSPSSYNPFLHYERAKARQKVVLDNMLAEGFIDEETHKQSFAQELIFKQSPAGTTRYGYFKDAVIEEAITILSQNNKYDNPTDVIYRGGLKIYTTMNAGLQAHAENLYANAANFPNQSVNNELIQSAMVLLDHRNGEVKAIMGGRKYENLRGFNRATSAYRQPGSAFKPIGVYAPALEQGYMPFYVIADKPISYQLSSGVWSPRNYDHQFRGLITMRHAIQWSVNTYAVQLADKVGIRYAFDFSKSMGIEMVDTPGQNDLGLSPLALGSLTKGATPLQMAAAYGVFANGGVYVEPYFINKIVDANGIEIYNHKAEFTRVMGADSAWLLNNMLQTVVTSGTGTNARLSGVVAAGKTGTSEEYRDSWFCGNTPAFSASVWMGYDKNHTMSTVYGGGFPAKIWQSMMQKAHENVAVSPQPRPANVVQVAICSRTGLLPSDLTPAGFIITEFSKLDKVPTQTGDIFEQIEVCPESGQLAGEFCPDPEKRTVMKSDEGIPEEICELHRDRNWSGVNGSNQFNDLVRLCRDPAHGGNLYRANTAAPGQEGGCPSKYIEKMHLPAPESIPYCPLPEHQANRPRTPGEEDNNNNSTINTGQNNGINNNHNGDSNSNHATDSNSSTNNSNTNRDKPMEPED